jgi:protein-tyrosine-phosphatase
VYLSREIALSTADPVVFLCSGNMVRSAFAELYARHLGFPRPVCSAATTYRNDALYPETAHALSYRGVDPDLIHAFRPTHLEDLVRTLSTRKPVFLAMCRHHLDELEQWPGWRGHGFLLDEEEIPDPVLEGADFNRTFDRVASCVEALCEELRGS